MGFPYFLIINFIFLLIHVCLCNGQGLKTCKFDKIYQFGDSISDTGNSIIEVPKAYHGFPPYGQTINKATGRPSDGYLMIDYISQSAGLPLNEPYENPKSNLTYGANFAVAGVTALRVETLLNWNIPRPYSNSSLLVQLKWFKRIMSKVCPNKKDCPGKLKSALFMIGTIGTNDYDFAFFQNYTIEEVKKMMVPREIRVISKVIKEVIKYGAVRVVVPGQFQMGCTPSLLTWFQFNKSSTFDSHGCLKDYNDFFMYHNNQLQAALKKIQKQNPNVHIVYGDIYHALQWVLDNLKKLGFKTFQQSCCGIGGKYNTSVEDSKICGKPGVPVCTDPKKHVYWDGGHFSHQTNKYLAEWLVKDMLPKLNCCV